MLKNIMLATIVSAALFSCDIRKQDTQAIAHSDSPATAPKSTTPVTGLTTVQMIDSVHDFGKVMDGEIVEFSYRFKNVGDKPLVIEAASASCGCTVPEKPDQPILPGEIGYIKVKFNSENRQGDALKTVQVTANTNPAFPQLVMKGQVLPKNN
jgi:hypothetical protein